MNTKVSSRVAKLIELAPPHLGSPVAFQRSLEMAPHSAYLWLATFIRHLFSFVNPPRTLLESALLGLFRSMPCCWQLFPPSDIKILEKHVDPSEKKAAFEWDGWTDAVQIMAKPSSNSRALHQTDSG
jgi:hypothetical protein